MAVSGGIDSMVMLHLFVKAGFSVGVAHCNFQLRGEEADKDEQLVRDACAALNAPVFATRFDTARYAEENGLSTQMAARELRYEFFKDVARHEGYDAIATAHNLDDVFETVLLNLTKGTGFEGITGIRVKNDNIVRPLLFADRKMILAYAVENAVPWREDASNLTDDYQRNFIRNNVVPSLREINPNLEATFRQTLERLSAASTIAKRYLETFASENITARNGDTFINIDAVQHERYPAVILWEVVKEFGFNFAQCQDIVNDHSAGRSFLSSGYRLIVDREYYIIHRANPHQIADVIIDESVRTISNGSESLSIEKRVRVNPIDRDKNLALLDAQKLSYPLRWRKWKNGDAFRPLGMSGVKKVSDFLIDCKTPLHEKANVTVLESNGEIVWVVGCRISEAYKITGNTKDVVAIRREKTTGKKNS